MTVPIFSSKASGLSPVSIFGTDLGGWWRADQRVTLDGFGNVSEWGDISANARNFTQPVALNRPLFSATGGPGNRPYLHSTGSTTAIMNITTGVAAETRLGDYAFIITASQTGAPTANVFFQTMTTPAGCSLLHLRQNTANSDPGVNQPTITAPTVITVTDPDFLPRPNWIAFGGSIESTGQRNFAVWGDGTVALTSDGVHAANFGAAVGEGRLFANFGGVTTPDIAIFELIMVRRAIDGQDLSLFRSYLRSTGVNT